MKPSLNLLLMLCFVLSFAQEKNVAVPQRSVDIIQVPVQPLELEKSRKDFSPNGVKLYYDADRNFVNLRFRRTLSEATIVFLDTRGRVISTYNGKKIVQVKINLARLKRGKYFVRVHSREIRDFLKVIKD